MKKVKTEIRRKQIKKAASEIISEDSLQRLTIGEIAKRVNITNSNIYRHYKGKEEIIEDLLKDINMELKEILSSANNEKNTTSTLKYIFFNHINLLKQYNGAPFIIFLDKNYMKHSNVQNIMSTVIRHYLSHIRKIILQGIEFGDFIELNDSKKIALVFLGNIQAVIFQWVISDFNFEIEERSEIFWNSFISGIIK